MLGIYALIMRLERQLDGLAVGRLGRFDFAAGYYLYIGSAFGSGGVPARVARHERASYARPRWHIDYLRPQAALVEVWLVGTEVRAEACWARGLAATPGVAVPAPGFGASDSPNASHLLYVAQRPAAEVLLAPLMSCVAQQYSTLEIRLLAG